MKFDKKFIIYLLIIFIVSCTTQKNNLKNNNQLNIEQIEQENYENFIAKGDNYFYSYNYTKAIEIYLDAINLFSSSHLNELNFKIATVFFENAEYDKAIKKFEIEKEFKKDDKQFYIGNCFYHLQDFEKALTYYKKCRETPAIINNIAYIYYCMGKNDDAKNYYLKLIGQNKDSLYQELANLMLALINNNQENIFIYSNKLITELNKYIQYYEKEKNVIYYDFYIMESLCHYLINNQKIAYDFLLVAVENGYRHFASLSRDPLFKPFITVEEIKRLESYYIFTKAF